MLGGGESFFAFCGRWLAPVSEYYILLQCADGKVFRDSVGSVTKCSTRKGCHMMRAVLLTGFEPFGGRGVNPSGEAAKNLHGAQIGETEVMGKVLPVSWKRSLLCLYHTIEDIDPVAVVMTGQGGRKGITPERIAVNVSHGTDNDEAKRNGEPVIPGGPDGIFSTLPNEQLVEALREEGIPANISNSAGTYLCNYSMYGLLHYLNQNDNQITAGFVHVPLLPQQAAAAARKKIAASMSQDTIDRATKVIIKEVLKT